MKKAFNSIIKWYLNPKTPKWVILRRRWRFKMLICVSFSSLLFAFFIVLLRNLYSPQVNDVHFLTINNKIKIDVEIVETNKDKAKGLGGRDVLNDDQGMLFVYDNPDYYTFWMKGMRFDIDFLWINNKKIVDITENVSHLDEQRIYSSREPVDRILEVNAGFIRKNNIKIGDEINTN